jgi:hypothetical protein
MAYNYQQGNQKYFEKYSQFRGYAMAIQRSDLEQPHLRLDTKMQNIHISKAAHKSP